MYGSNSHKILKKAADVLACPLAQIMNLFVKLFLFSEECKIADPKSLFKKGRSQKLQTYFISPSSVQNY